MSWEELAPVFRPKSVHMKFKQDGAVPREFRPITWFREGPNGPGSRSEPIARP